MNGQPEDEGSSSLSRIHTLMRVGYDGVGHWLMANQADPDFVALRYSIRRRRDYVISCCAAIASGGLSLRTEA